VVVAESVLVDVDGVEFYVEVVDEGAGTVGLDDRFSFDGVRATVEAIARQLTGVWERVKPSEASVEFGLKVTGKSGKLTGLLVEAGGDASLKVKLTWKADTAAGVPAVT
jgi:hypothetical protein